MGVGAPGAASGKAAGCRAGAPAGWLQVISGGGLARRLLVVGLTRRCIVRGIVGRRIGAPIRWPQNWRADLVISRMGDGGLARQFARWRIGALTRFDLSTLRIMKRAKAPALEDHHTTPSTAPIFANAL